MNRLLIIIVLSSLGGCKNEIAISVRATKDGKSYWTAPIAVCVDCVIRGGDLFMPSYW